MLTTGISFVVVFGLLVFFHEFGHFALAKLNNIKVHQFALGMGPKLLSFKGKETEYSVRLFPIGGYVRMEGEDESSDDERSFSAKSPLQRISVLAAGPIMNIVLAIILVAIIAFNFGAPVNIIDKTTENSPAQIVGFKSGDKIIKINETDINNWDDIVNAIGNSKDDMISISVVRNGEILSFDVTPQYDEETKRQVIGITPVMKKSILNSLKLSVNAVFLGIKQIFEILYQLITGQVSAGDQVVGPVGMVHYIDVAVKSSIFDLIAIAANISISLAIFNILPLPALDGGRIMFAIIELIKGSPVDPEKEGFVHMLGLVALLILMVVVVYKDIIRFNLL